MAERWATFDTYGTLIDWNDGIGTQLARLWPDADTKVLLARYHEIEPRVQLEGSLTYREVLMQALRLLAEAEGLELRPEDEPALAESLPSWRPFPEVPGELEELRRRGWRVVLLSNTDPDLLAASRAQLGVELDGQITAADAGSYKPAHGHWRAFYERFGADSGRHVHVAVSLFHDIAPAAELGLPAIWINRHDETSDLPRAAELPTLAGLADELDAIVPR